MWVNTLIAGILANVGFFSIFKYFQIQIETGVMIEQSFARLTKIFLYLDEVPWVCTLICLIITDAFVIAWLGATYKTQDLVKDEQ